MLPAHVFGSSEASLQRTLAEEGLDAAKERILPAALPALMLVPQRTAPKTFASQIGGDPWLPPGDWPSAPAPTKSPSKEPASKAAASKAASAKKAKTEPAKKADPGVPYGLVAQIPIRDLPRIPNLEFPPRGTLWFYLNEKAPVIGCTLHSEVLPADLTQRPRPDAAPVFPARAVRYEPILTLPQPGTRAHGNLRLRGADAARYERAVAKNCAAHSGVQLFGHPSGMLKGDLFDPLGAKEGELTLLLSIEGKSELGWSKPGTLYYVIKKSDLASGKLDRTHIIIVR